MRTVNRSTQRGVGTLAVSMLLLMGMSITVFYLNRGLVFEQKTSAAQMQSAKAREIAEAGVEWATGMLNDPTNIGTNCASDGSGVNDNTFRVRYVQTQLNAAVNPSTDVIPNTTTFPGCRITDAGLTTCNCPTAAGPASLGTNVQASFTVAFSTVTNAATGAVDTDSVLITATGCTDNASACTAANATASSGPDATATVSVVLKLAPELRAMPASPLTCGLACQVGGSYNIENSDVATNGITVNAGTTITTGNGVTVTTLDGMPSQNALVGSDSSLADLASNDSDCSDSAIFSSYFGTTIENYRDSLSTMVMSCSSTSDCVSQLETAYDEGWRSFYFTSDLQLSGNGTLGSVAEPVMIVSPNAITVNGNWTLYGLVFSNSADWNNLGTGSATVQGAQITCADYRNNGNGTLAYNPDVLRNLQNGQAARMARVPGSWRDFTPGAN
jgi:hypothetical protein